MTISNGTNGAEGCIINPMEDVLNVLKDLRYLKYVQVRDIGEEVSIFMYAIITLFTC